MANFLYLPPHKMVSLYAGVSATVDTDYTDDWLCDGRAGRPVRTTDGSLSATVTPLASGTVNIAAVCNHNLTVNATLGGDLSGTITAGAMQQDGIPLNGFLSFNDVAGVDSVTLAVSGNSADVIIGEFIFGQATSLTLPHYREHEVEIDGFGRSVEVDLSSVPPYDAGMAGRTWSATWPALTTAERNGLVDCYLAQRGLTRPTLIVPHTDVNDAWVCFIVGKPKYKPADVPNRWTVSLTFQEVPRSRW